MTIPQCVGHLINPAPTTAGQPFQVAIPIMTVRVDLTGPNNLKVTFS